MKEKQAFGHLEEHEEIVSKRGNVASSLARFEVVQIVFVADFVARDRGTP